MQICHFKGSVFNASNMASRSETSNVSISCFDTLGGVAHSATLQRAFAMAMGKLAERHAGIFKKNKRSIQAKIHEPESGRFCF